MDTPHPAYLVGFAYPDAWYDNTPESNDRSSPGVWIEEIVVKDRYRAGPRSANALNTNLVPVWRYSYTNKVLFVIGSGPKRLDFTSEYEAFDPKHIFLSFAEAQQKAAENLKLLQAHINQQRQKWDKLHCQWCDEQSMFRQMAEAILPSPIKKDSESYISPFTGKQE